MSEDVIQAEETVFKDTLKSKDCGKMSVHNEKT